MARIAFSTIGILKTPLEHAEVKAFFEGVEETFAAAKRCDGFIRRTVRDYETFLNTSGDMVFAPAFRHFEDKMRVVSTLSLWEDLESVAAFTHHRIHGEATGKRHEWFVPQDAPTYVAWWVDDGHTPTFEEAAGRFQHLQEHGPSAFAFDFRNPFNPAGMIGPLDSNAVRAKVNLNNAG